MHPATPGGTARAQFEHPALFGDTVMTQRLLGAISRRPQRRREVRVGLGAPSADSKLSISSMTCSGTVVDRCNSLVASLISARRSRSPTPVVIMSPSYDRPAPYDPSLSFPSAGPSGAAGRVRGPLEQRVPLVPSWAHRAAPLA